MHKSMEWIEDDGGRSAAGFKGDTGDCVTRAIAIATERPYREVYAAMNEASKSTRRVHGLSRGGSARTGLSKRHYHPYLLALGWEWTPMMQIGTGCTTHLRKEDLPGGRLIAKVSRHLVAVIDGVIHDTYDCGRGGWRCVYGYYRRPSEPLSEEDRDMERVFKVKAVLPKLCPGCKPKVLPAMKEALK